MAVSSCSSWRSTDTPRQITSSRAGAFEAALTSGADGLTAAWYDTRDGNAEIYLRALDGDGRVVGPERRLTSNPEESYEASIDAHGDAIAVAWYDKTRDGTLTGRLGVWSRDGTRQWEAWLPPHTRNPVLRSNGGEVFVAWIGEAADGTEAVWAGRWNARGAAIGVPRQIGPAHRTTWNINAALDQHGGAWVVFDAVAVTRASELFLARVDRDAATLRRLTRDDGAESKYPDIAVKDGRVALTWYDARDGNTEIYLWVADTSAMSGEIDTTARRVTETAAESIGAYLAWNGDHVGLAWSDAAAGQHEIYFQPFDLRGQPLAAARRLTDTRTASLIPAIEPWRDGFALAWGEYLPSSEPHGGTSEIMFAIVR